MRTILLIVLLSLVCSAGVIAGSNKQDAVPYRTGTSVEDLKTRQGIAVEAESGRTGTSVEDLSTRYGTAVEAESGRTGTSVEDLKTRTGTSVEDLKSPVEEELAVPRQ